VWGDRGDAGVEGEGEGDGGGVASGPVASRSDTR
jgi:hypothetical protein